MAWQITKGRLFLMFFGPYLIYFALFEYGSIGLAIIGAALALWGWWWLLRRFIQ